MNRLQKIQFLKDYQAGRRKIEELLPMRIIHIHNNNGIRTNEKGKKYTKDEIERLESISVNTIFLEHVHSDVPIATREEDVDMTPYRHKYSIS